MDDDQQSSISTISTLTDKKRTHFADDEEKNMWKFLIKFAFLLKLISLDVLTLVTYYSIIKFLFVN